MVRVATTNYAGAVDTTFQWATVDTDRFDREFDLYRLAQALELHDHTAGKGLSVGRVLNGLINTAQLANGAVDATKLSTDAVTAVAVALDAIGALELADNSVDTAAIQALAVTAAKLAAGVAVANLGYTPVNKAGDTLTGNLTFSDDTEGIILSGGGLLIDVNALGTLLRGNLDNILLQAENGSATFLTVTAALVSALGNLQGVRLISTQADGTPPLTVASTTEVGNLNASRVSGKIPTATPAAGALPLADGSGKLDAWVTAAVGVPAGNGSYVHTAASIPSGYARDNGGVAGTITDGRYLVGAGAATGISNAITYIENTSVGSDTQHVHTGPSHQHSAAALGVQNSTGAADQTEDAGSGADVAASDGHAHPSGSLDVSGNTDAGGTGNTGVTAWQTPSRVIVWIKKS